MRRISFRRITSSHAARRAARSDAITGSWSALAEGTANDPRFIDPIWETGVGRVAHILGVVDEPGEARRMHLRAVPRVVKSGEAPVVYVALGDSTGVGVGALKGGGYVARLFERRGLGDGLSQDEFNDLIAYLRSLQ